MSTFQTLVSSPIFHLPIFALVGASAFQGLVALWAASSRVHWFWRALALWGAVVVLVPIRAYEPALMFAVSGPLTVGLVLAFGSIFNRGASANPEENPTDSNSSFRFALRDLFLLVLLVALIIVGLSAIRPGYEWREMAAYVICGVIFAVIFSVTYACVAGRPWWLSAMLLAGAIAAAGLSMSAICGSSPAARLWQPLGLMYGPQFSLDEAAVIALAYAELALVVGAFSWLFRSCQIAQRTASRAIACGSLAAFVPTLAVPLALLYWHMLRLAPLPPRFSTGTTHYERIVTVAHRLQSMGPMTNPSSQLEFRALLEEAIGLLEAPNFVPCDPQTDATQQAFDQRLADVQALRALSRALAAATPPALTAADEVQATKLSLANVRLGVMLSRGGTIIDRLVGIAVQGVGQQRLAASRSELSPNQARAAIRSLRNAAAEREDVALTIARDAAMCERAFGWQGRLENVMLQLRGRPSPAEQAMREAMRRETASENLLQADLAIRLFVHDHQMPPDHLAQLVPEYLPDVPIDPYSQQPLRYRAEEDQFVVYSAGQDGRDDGGRFGNLRQYLQSPGYDYDLETATRP